MTPPLASAYRCLLCLSSCSDSFKDGLQCESVDLINTFISNLLLSGCFITAIEIPTGKVAKGGITNNLVALTFGESATTKAL